MSAITLFFGSLLGVTSWLSPIRYQPWLSFQGELLMAVACLLMLIGQLATQRSERLTLSPLMLGTAVAIVLPLVQSLVGLIRFAGDAWVAFGYLLAFALAQVLGQMLSRRFGASALLEALAALFVSASIASVGLQLIQWLGLEGLGIYSTELKPGRSPYANVAQPNHLASMLFLGVIGLLFLFERRRVRGTAAAVTYCVLAFGLVMTGSRTAWVTMGCSTVALLLVHGRAALEIGRTRIALAAAVFFVFLMAWPAINDGMLLTQGRTFADQAQVGSRPLLWSSMLGAISMAPWFGYGWGQGLVAHSLVVDAFPAGGRLIGNSHNLVLDLMVWNGVPLALFFCSLLAWWFWRQCRFARSATQLCMLAAVAALFVHAMLEFPLNYAYFLLPVGVMMGALDFLAPTDKRVRIALWPAWTLTTAASVLLSLIVFDYVQVEENTQTLQLEMARIGTHEIVSKAPDLVVLTQWAAYLHFIRIEPRPGMSSAELEQMKSVVERFPYSVAQLKMAAAAAMNSQPDVAARILVTLCKLHTPKNCAQRLLDWSELSRKYPELDVVRLPPVMRQSGATAS